MRLSLLAALPAFGCSARLLASQSTDAPPTADARLSDSALVSDTMTAARRVVYLEFGGVDLVQGANQHSDATTTPATAGWMSGTATTGRAPAYADQTSIGAITTGVASRLQNLAIVTTTRPASGDYVMIIFGGTATDVHSAFAGGVSQIDCGDQMKNDVGWLPDGMTADQAADAAIGAIALGLGLTSVDDPTDCTCEWGNYQHCARTASPCLLHDGATRDQNVVADPNTGLPLVCPGATQDEIATIAAAFR